MSEKNSAVDALRSIHRDPLGDFQRSQRPTRTKFKNREESDSLGDHPPFGPDQEFFFVYKSEVGAEDDVLAGAFLSRKMAHEYKREVGGTRVRRMKGKKGEDLFRKAWELKSLGYYVVASLLEEADGSSFEDFFWERES